jgi:hypothetical protein
MFDLTEDATPAPRLPRPDSITLDGWHQPGRQVVFRLDGRERHGIVLVTFTYGARRALRIAVRAEHGLPQKTCRWWWTDTSMRWP